MSEITISFEELKQKAEYKQTSICKFIDDLDRMYRKLMEIACKIRTNSKRTVFVLFPTFELSLFYFL